LKSLFQFQQRAWTREEWEIPTILQGLGPNDIETEEGPEKAAPPLVHSCRT
jgi:hypothetical protein